MVAVANEWLNDRFNKGEMLTMVRINLTSKAILIRDVLIDYLDGYDDIPLSSLKRNGGGGGGGAALPSSGSSGSAGLYPCSVCNRTFASDRIQHHEAACMKASKQRRVFDSTKQRLTGTEAASYFRKGKGGKGRNEPAKPQVILIFDDAVRSNISVRCVLLDSEVKLETKA